MKTLEKDIEGAFVRYARRQGCEAIKFADPARRGAPDRIVLCPRGCLFFIEFKRRDQKPRPEQLIYHRVLTKLGYDVFVIDDYQDAKQLLDGFLASFVPA